MKRSYLLIAFVIILAGVLGLDLAAPVVSAQGEITVSILCSQYLRSDPSDSSPRVGLMNPGESHQALGRYGWWVLVQVSEDLRGWAYDGVCLRVRGEFEALPLLDPGNLPAQEYTGSPVLEVQCSQYVRTLPDVNAARVAVMQPSDRPWQVNARSADGGWYLVSSADGGLAGWTASTSCVSLRGAIDALPVSGVQSSAVGGGSTARVLCSQNLRSLPSLDGERFKILQSADGPLTVLGRSVDSRWVFVQLASGQQGWTYLNECLAVQGDVASLPVRAADAFSGPPSALISCPQVVRQLPLPDSPVVRTLQPSDGPLPIAGITSEAGWLYFEFPDGTSGWTVNAFCMSVLGRVWDAPRYAEGILPDLALPPDTTPYATFSCAQYLRAAPAMDAERLTILEPGSGLFTVTGRSADGGWLRVANQGLEGWAAQGTCLKVQGDILLAPVAEAAFSGPPVGQLICDQYLRAGPNIGADVLDPMFLGTRLTLLSKSADGAWVYVSKSDGSLGWTALGACLSVTGDIAGLPVMSALDMAAGTSTASLSCTQYLRAEPDGDAEALRVLDGSEGRLQPVGRTASGSWVELALVDGTRGWAATGFCVNVVGDFNSLPITEPQPVVYSGPPVAEIACNLNLRRTPTSGGTVLSVLGPDSGMWTPIARTDDLRWLVLDNGAGRVGWASFGSCLQTQGDIDALPVAVGPSDRGVWTVLQVAGSCGSGDALAGLVAAYNRSGTFAPVSRACMAEADALAALAADRAEFALVAGGCPGFEGVTLADGQRLCYKTIHQSQVDDFLAFVTG